MNTSRDLLIRYSSEDLKRFRSIEQYKCAVTWFFKTKYISGESLKNALTSAIRHEQSPVKRSLLCRFYKYVVRENIESVENNLNKPSTLLNLLIQEYLAAFKRKFKTDSLPTYRFVELS